MPGTFPGGGGQLQSPLLSPNEVGRGRLAAGHADRTESVKQPCETAAVLEWGLHVEHKCLRWSVPGPRRVVEPRVSRFPAYPEAHRSAEPEVHRARGRAVGAT